MDGWGTKAAEHILEMRHKKTKIVCKLTLIMLPHHYHYYHYSRDCSLFAFTATAIIMFTVQWQVTMKFVAEHLLPVGHVQLDRYVWYTYNHSLFIHCHSHNLNDEILKPNLERSTKVATFRKSLTTRSIEWPIIILVSIWVFGSKSSLSRQYRRKCKKKNTDHSKVEDINMPSRVWSNYCFRLGLFHAVTVVSSPSIHPLLYFAASASALRPYMHWQHEKEIHVLLII